MKKALFTLGTLAAVATPIAAVVSCGSTDKSFGTSERKEISLEPGTFIQRDNTITGVHNIKDVAAYMNKYLVLNDPSTFKLDKYGFQALTRMGTDKDGKAEINEYAMDKDGKWAAEFERLNKAGQLKDMVVKYHDHRDEYLSGKGFARFEPYFEVFENVYLEFNSNFDYTNGGKLKFDLVVKDRAQQSEDIKNSVAIWTPLLAADGKDYVSISSADLKAKFANTYDDKPATDVAKAKETIKLISNTYKTLSESTNKLFADEQIKKLSEYFDKSTLDFFSKTLGLQKVQDYINAHIDDIYNDFVKYPATSAEALSGMDSVMTDPAQVTNFATFVGWLAADKAEKRNLILGIKLLQYIIEQAHIL